MSGDGSIFKRTRTSPNGREYVRWQVQVSTGPRTNRVRTNRTCRTRAEAKRILDELIADQREGRSLSRASLGAYLRRWLDETARDIAPNTRKSYEQALAHLAPLSHISVAELTVEDVEDWRNGLPLGPKSANTYLAVLRSALQVATDRGHVRRNVARLVPLRRLPRQRKEAMTAESARAILAAVKEDRYAAAYALALCGLRVSEVLGLAWADVAPDSSSVRILWQLDGSGKTATRRKLKTDSSEATLHLPRFATELLEQHRKRLPKGQLVFLTPKGYPVERGWLGGLHLKALLRAAGLPEMSIHDLRHGTATLLAAEGVPLRVSMAYLRHTSSRIHVETYQHVSAAQERAAAEALQRAVG